MPWDLPSSSLHACLHIWLIPVCSACLSCSLPVCQSSVCHGNCLSVQAMHPLHYPCPFTCCNPRTNRIAQGTWFQHPACLDLTASLIGQWQARTNTTPASVVCRAKDSYAQLASAWRLVQVQQQYAVTLTLPLTLSAANLTDAQAQADVLTATSNATDALESALAAGLISGEPVLDGLLLLLLGCWLVPACSKQIKHVLGIQPE